jgi:arginyl-tRNA synthetase
MSSAILLLKQKLQISLPLTLGAEISLPEPLLVPASNPKFGDYQSNLPLALAKTLGKPPRSIAEEIVKNLDLADICEVSIAGAGFINFTLKPSYLETQLQQIYGDSRLGIAVVQEPQRIVVDFSSPNIAKEMHVGHLRSTIIGDSIARILEFQGHEVLRLNHVGDWGTQFGMLIAYLQAAYPEALVTQDALDLGDLVAFYRQAKQRFDADLEFQEKSRQEVVKLQSGVEATRRAWQLLCQQSRREFQVIYDLLGVELIERGESFYNPFLGAVVEDLTQLGLLAEDGGAKCVFLEGFTNKSGDQLPLIIQKTDGGYNYATTDLAALRYRIKEDQAQKIIYVTDAGQANHFAQFFQVARRAGWIPDTVELVHVPFGLVKGEDGKKLKTRSGDTIRLQDLLDEAIDRTRQDLEQRLIAESRPETAEFINHTARIIGLSAVKYADLSQNRTSDYIFSYDKMLNLQGNTAPYLLYAYVRVQGISRKGEIDLDQLTNPRLILQEAPEITLAKHILALEEVLVEVTQDLYPNRLCQYLFELSQKFNQFLEQCPVLKAEEPIRTSRLVLCNLTARTLKLGLSLLGISVLERM